MTNHDKNVKVNGDKPVLEEVAKQSTIYIVGEGNFRNQEELDASRAARGDKPYIIPLKKMGYTPEIMNYFVNRREKIKDALKKEKENGDENLQIEDQIKAEASMWPCAFY
ncbi:hypothetical protein HOE37_05250 [Candidatus Woesearchaeota archaeon]|jgi:DNA polymerase elongation subunit (family B)|nr:hypothetical protein [Candidatus Woesearchaeota archaeon]MBT4111238.1 hypothetical protein [Candidatus Woesearchaeota archaeon]MBT4336818.1 hypothetical protein [Candidatus Woesearchaeota archaeon]MBT4469486.1 hypothetical protein [Candidatus Woesearchaeota archaeon]MBT6744119.1 hypothetical protein [Candidatus Woesearchaeota archaeon]